MLRPDSGAWFALPSAVAAQESPPSPAAPQAAVQEPTFRTGIDRPLVDKVDKYVTLMVPWRRCSADADEAK
jgi:hypothetical protein